MQTEALTHYSKNLKRDMHLMIYGSAGVPILGFPTQNSMCRNYEDFGMIDRLKPFIDDGRIQIFVVDSVDRESWSDREGDKGLRAARQEQYYHYIMEEVIPLIKDRNARRAPVAVGLSMGANHAAISFLRRPELFSGLIALSGVYDSDYFFDGWMNPTLYDNSPERFLPNMPEDHEYIDLYNRRAMIFCCGQGAWEEDGIRTLKHLERVFREKGIHAWCDFWGSDVNHDWPWWYKQMEYFLPFILNN